MVYYYTSKNVKLIRNLMLDYQTINEATPQEYMKTYFESCPRNIDDLKLSWIVESFLGIYKHNRFLKKISTEWTEELSEEEKDYFLILFYAIVFQISPKESSSFLYKCMFNLSKVLLEKITKVLSNIDVWPLISQIAETEYDKTFVTESIKSRIFSWQPELSKINEIYKKHRNKIETRNLKMPTIPIEMNIYKRTDTLNRKYSKHDVEKEIDTQPALLPDKRSKMLTNSKINIKLNRIREKNRLKALNLHAVVKNNKFHHTQGKCTKIDTNVQELDREVKHKRIIIPIKMLNSSPEIKTTTATVKRISERIKIYEQEEVKWLQNILDGAGNLTKIEDLINYDRQEREKERLFDIKRKHLMGQISYEEALIAKKKVFYENKRKCEELLQEKKLWEKEIEEWKLKEIENNRKQVEKLSLIELDVINARNHMTQKRKETAEKLRQDTKEMKQNALKMKQTELERRITMIKEIKILTMIAKKSKIPKIIDLTESSGLGFLCEMSIIELQERLAAMKIGLKEEIEEKRNKINTINREKKQELEALKRAVNEHMSEKAKLRKEIKLKINKDLPMTAEIDQLRNILLEKRNQRMMLAK